MHVRLMQRLSEVVKVLSVKIMGLELLLVVRETRIELL